MKLPVNLPVCRDAQVYTAKSLTALLKVLLKSLRALQKSSYLPFVSSNNGLPRLLAGTAQLSCMSARQTEVHYIDCKLLHKPNLYYGGYSSKMSKGMFYIQPLSVLNQSTIKCICIFFLQASPEKCFIIFKLSNTLPLISYIIKARTRRLWSSSCKSSVS